MIWVQLLTVLAAVLIPTHLNLRVCLHKFKFESCFFELQIQQKVHSDLDSGRYSLSHVSNRFRSRWKDDIWRLRLKSYILQLRSSAVRISTLQKKSESKWTKSVSGVKLFIVSLIQRTCFKTLSRVKCRLYSGAVYNVLSRGSNTFRHF